MWFQKVLGDYRVTGSSEGLKIEVLDYHADPLVLTRDDLRRLGLYMVPAQEKEAPESPISPGRAARP